MPTPAYKRCARCGETKSLDSFHRNRARTDGRQTFCKECNSAGARAWERTNRQRAAANKRQWGRVNRDRADEIAKRKRERYPEKERARNALNHAIKRGDLKRPTHCEECGGRGEPTADGRSPLQAHHADYSKPLEVEWLCSKCHGSLHRPSTREAPRPPLAAAG